MNRYADELGWIDSQRERMTRLVTDWCNINSGTYHVAGVERCAEEIIKEFAVLGGEIRRLPLPAEEAIDSAGRVAPRALAPAVQIIKPRPGGLRVLLCIHLDTVYGEEHSFRRVSHSSDGMLRGPGVADAKGGIAVMLVALQALERSRLAERIFWEVLLNTDEEIGSVGSVGHLKEIAGRNEVGLLFEPALPDGALVGDRKGSGNFTAVFRGRSAHAGRAPELGRNAIHAMAEFIAVLSRAGNFPMGVTLNVGKVEGGGPVNVVPDLAIARFNIRVETAEQQQAVEKRLVELTADVNGREGFSLAVHGGFTSPPRPVTGRTLELFRQVAACGKELGLELCWRSSGGVSDGNKLAAAGLPNVDNLGVRGGDIHSEKEFMLIDSLTERARLTALLLLKLAGGEIAWRAGH